MDLREESVPARYPEQLFSAHKSVRNRYIRLRNYVCSVKKLAFYKNWYRLFFLYTLCRYNIDNKVWRYKMSNNKYRYGIDKVQ